MLRVKFFTFLLIFNLSIVFVFSQNISEITVVTEEWEDCTNKDLSGLYFDILREVFEPEGISLNVKFEPYARSLETIKSKSADIVVGVYKDELENVIYPKLHFGADDVVVCFMKEKNIRWNGEATLKDSVLSWIRKYNYNEYLSIKPKRIEIVDKRDSGIKMMMKKRVDFFIDNSYDMEATIEEMGLDRSLFDIKFIKFLNLYFCFVNDEKGKRLANMYDKNFKTLIQNGKIKKLYEEYEMLANYNF